MSNPILTSDLLKDDGAIQNTIKQLQQLSNEYKAFIGTIKAQSTQLEVKVRQSNVSTVSQRDEFKKTAKQVDELQKQYDKYVSLLDDNAVKIAALKNGQSQLNKVNKLEATIASSRNGSMEQLNAQLKLNKIRLDQMTESGKENTREGYELNDQTERLTARIKELKDEQRKAIKVRELERKAAESQVGSYDQLSAQYSLLKIRLNAMSAEQRKNTTEGQKMEKQSAAIYDEMKRLQEVTGKHTLNVGNYTNSIVSAFARQKQLNEELKKAEKEFNDLPKSVKKSDKAQQEYLEHTKELKDEIESLASITGKTAKDVEALTGNQESLLDAVSDLPGVLGDAGGGVQALSGKFKALLANPVVLVIGLIVGGLYALFKAFKQSEKGVQFMTKASGFINGIWSQTIKLVDSLVGGILYLFEKPQQAIKDFGSFIIDNVVNRFKAVVKFAEIVGDAVGKLLKGDFDGLKDSAKDAASAMVQFTTGLDAEQQRDFANAIKETSKEVANQTQAFVDLEVAKRAIANSNREVAKSVEKLITDEQLYQSIADDTTKSFAVREEAAENARKATEQRAKREIQIARNNLKLINTELDLRRSNGEAVDDLLDRQLGAYRELSGAEREYSLAVRDNEKTRDELKQDRLERDLDILIDGFDNQKTINEKLIQDDRKTFQERKKLFQETVKLSDDSFAQQIETIQKFTGIAVDANGLIQESDAVALNQRIRSLGLSEIIEGRLLEIVRDRRLAIQDLSEAERDLAQSGRDDELSRLSVQQTLAEAEFDLVKRAETEKAEFQLEQKRQTLEKVNQLNQQFTDILPPIDSAELEVEIRKLETNLVKIKRESAITQFDQQQQLAESEFSLLETSERQKTEFRLNAERERLLKILELNEKFGSDMTELQKQIARNQVKAIENELAGLKQPAAFNIYDSLGLNLSDEQQQAMATSFDFAKNQVFELASTRTKIAQQNVTQANEEIALAEQVLQREIEAQRAGEANKVETAQRELTLAKTNQKKALDDQRKAQRAEIALQSIMQASNLVTASTKIFAQLGFPFALPAIATMWGTFIASKARALSLTKSPRSKGGLDIIGNGTHASGNDTYLGYSDSVGPVYAERGEAHMTLRPAVTRRYKNVLPEIYKALDNGTFLSTFNNQANYSNQIPLFTQNTMIDTGKMESQLDVLIDQNAERYHKNANGEMVRVYKNLKQTFV